MKYLPALATLWLATNTFAAEGDADKLAGSVFGIIGVVVAIFIFVGIVLVIGEIAEACHNFWSNSTTIGKLLVFGIPLSVMAFGIFYGIFYYVVPWIISITPFLLHNTVGNIVLVIVAEFIFIAIGWKLTTDKKRRGIVPTFARFIVLFPLLPVIYTFYYLIQLLKKACIKDAVVSFNPHIVRLKENIDQQ